MKYPYLSLFNHLSAIIVLQQKPRRVIGLHFTRTRKPIVCCSIWQMFWSYSYRWDDRWTNKDPFHGWDIDGSRQLHHLSNCKMPATDCASRRGHHTHVPTSACSWDLWPVWWHHPPIRGSDCLPGASGVSRGVFRDLWLSLSWEERHCWLLARGNTITIISI